MCTSDGDRRDNRRSSSRTSLILLSAAIFFLAAAVIPACAAAPLNATFFVHDGAEAFHAEIEIINAERYAFVEPGLLGEEVPRSVTNTTLRYTDNNTASEFKTDAFGRSISFEKGNYTIEYDAALKNKDFQFIFSALYNITLNLPQGYDVRNPLLGMTSTGSAVSTVDSRYLTEELAAKNVTFTGGNGTIQVFWQNRAFAECRFYDEQQVFLLEVFGSIWLAVAAIFAVPYIMTRRRME